MQTWQGILVCSAGCVLSLAHSLLSGTSRLNNCQWPCIKIFALFLSVGRPSGQRTTQFSNLGSITGRNR